MSATDAFTPSPVRRIMNKKGFTVRDAPMRYRVSPDKIRAWIRQGRLQAINTAANLAAKPRFVILPHHLAEFEKGRATGPPPEAHSPQTRNARLHRLLPRRVK
jgi:hypothetical protein